MTGSAPFAWVVLNKVIYSAVHEENKESDIRRKVK